MDNYINDKKLFLLYGLELIDWYDANDLINFSSNPCHIDTKQFLNEGYCQWFDINHNPTKSYVFLHFMKYTEKFIEDIINAS